MPDADSGRRTDYIQDETLQDITESIKAVIFDLDNTIFDHNRVQRESLHRIHSHYSDTFKGLEFPVFFDHYIENNELVWNQLFKGEITKETLRLRRFADILEFFGLDSSPALEMTDKYLDVYTEIAYFMKGARELLDNVRGRFKLGMVTNGFADIQFIKLENLGIKDYFDVVVTSDEARAMKPDARIFEAAVKRLNCLVSECLFIGDSYENDIAGAAKCGMRTIWYRTEDYVIPESSPVPDVIVTDLESITAIIKQN